VIFSRLKEHISNQDEYALESLFDLCAAFALDLQVDPYFAQTANNTFIFLIIQILDYLILSKSISQMN